MKGYKVFNPDWKCRDFQFEVGKIFKEDIDPKCCDRGFHFCTKASDCFKYYNFDPKNKVAEVEALGIIHCDGDDTKHCTNKIHIIRELTWYEVLDLVNTGKDCTGYCNSGDWNSGDWNKTCYSNGCFNTELPKIFLFNKLSDWTYQDWLNSKARYILNNIPSNTLEWIWSEDMTDEEKVAHPEHQVTEGYLKYVEKETGRQDWWNRLSNEEKKIVMDLPNFDKDIFKEITGIEV